jgi:hypothetical protein
MVYGGPLWVLSYGKPEALFDFAKCEKSDFRDFRVFRHFGRTKTGSGFATGGDPGGTTI